MRAPARTADPLRRWSIADSLETYAINSWGGSYFSINEAGNLTVHPSGSNVASIDMKALVDEVTKRGIQPPLLFRFPDVLRSRIEILNEAFATAITEAGYKASYRGVYPIKVNQARRVVEEIVTTGRKYHYGLEAGSKPELLAVMAMLDDEEAIVVCNGYKDEEYIETALLASKLGRTVIMVVEKPSELELIRRVSEQIKVRPTIGLRVRLSSRGSGRWEQSGGDRSKFGLSAAEIVQSVEQLRAWEMLDCCKLLHFHLGSQISAIRSIKNALREAGRFFVELRQIGCTSLSYFDVGGGLGVDYDGSQTNFESSMNYTVQEYANDVVFTIQELCDAANVPHPTLVSESGRAVVAHHAVLVLNVLGVSEFAPGEVPKALVKKSMPQAHNLHEIFQTVNRKNVLEYYHDALEIKDQVLQLFLLGHLSLENRVLCENLFWAINQKILGIVRSLPHVPEELEGLEKTMSDTYFCNFSMFQSLPDAWAVDQLFPIVPIHRLGEEPTRRAILADITCDSDGKIDQFIDPRDVKPTLELHTKSLTDEYYIGIFLVGAYQEILGDMHNLFGDTNTVHVSLGPDGSYRIDEVVAGDTVTDVLRYVDYQPEELMRRLRQNVETALRKQLLTLDESRYLVRRYGEGLAGYTYLESE